MMIIMNMQMILLFLAAVQLPIDEAKYNVQSHKERCQSLESMFLDPDVSQCIWQKAFVLCVGDHKKIQTYLPVEDFLYYTIKCQHNVEQKKQEQLISQ